MNTFHSYVRTPPPMLFVDDFLTVPLDITTPPSIRTAPASPVATPLNISHSSLTKVDNSLSSSTPSTPSKSFHSSHNSQPSHFQTPPNSSHIRPSFDARDKALSDFFFQKPSKLLSQYTKILLTKDVQTYHINVIVEYFASRNNLEQLLIELVTEEIETTNINNQLFRGNNTFTRAYSVYLKMYCNDYLNKTSIAFLDYLKETGFNDDHLDSTEKHSIDLKDSIVTLYCTLLLDNVSLIPTHMRLLIKHVYEKILNKRGELEANKAVSTLLFLRYLLVPFVASPNLFKCVQCFVTQVINEMSPGCSQECFF
ncbi:Ras-GAP domain-containing protein [Entamoeba marina]